MKISLLERADVDSCAILFVRVFNAEPWKEAWNFEVALKRLTNCFLTPDFIGAGAWSNGELFGFALGYIEVWDKGETFYLKEMCVTPDLQRQGIGTILLNALEERLNVRGINKIFLHTANATAAQSFYEKYGFAVNSKMIMMSKRLSSEKTEPR